MYFRADYWGRSTRISHGGRYKIEAYNKCRNAVEFLEEIQPHLF